MLEISLHENTELGTLKKKPSINWSDQTDQFTYSIYYQFLHKVFLKFESRETESKRPELFREGVGHACY